MEPHFDLPPLLLRIPDAARLLGVGRSLTYQLIAEGELEVVRVGSVMRVPVTAVEEFVGRQRTLTQTGRVDQ